jgi:hypothetical protein
MRPGLEEHVATQAGRTEASPGSGQTLKSIKVKSSMSLTAILLTIALVGFARLSQAEAGVMRVFSAPAGEPLSTDYQVSVEGQEVPVYGAKVAPADRERRWKAMDDKANSANFYEMASFVYFDMQEPVTVTVTCAEAIRSAKVLPASFNLKPSVNGKRLTLILNEPKPVTLEVNGNWVGALHIFANPIETNIPKPDAPGVIYFGPGIHEISHRVVTNNQVVYLAGGAVVRGVILPDEKYQVSSYSGLRTYSPTFELRGTNITFRGRGILDGSRSTTHARNLVLVRGRDITLEGVILRDSSTWTIPIRQSDRVMVRNVKLLGYRANSDGIDICNSRDVTVRDCFIRTLDDLIVVKTDRDQGESRHIVARDCVLWNEVAHALSIGAELRQDVTDVLFSNCDVIHDKGREWTLRVYHCDSARISNVRFENIRVEESPRLISLWIGKAVWTRDEQRGHIDQVSFQHLRAQADPVRVELKGFDESHQVANVAFDDVQVNGKPLTAAEVKTNEFVRDIVVRP